MENVLLGQLSFVALVFGLKICLAEKHMILHLGLAVDKIYTTDGATILSSYNKSHPLHAQWIMLVPPKPDQRFLIQFQHLDIPCPQKLTITEADVRMGIFSATVGGRILENFCGTLNDLFPVNRFDPSEHFLKTNKKGYALDIMWSAGPNAVTPTQGLRLLITAFSQKKDCPKGRFSCRQMCINEELVCDGYPHCLDQADESANCTQVLHKIIDAMPVCLPSPCGEAGLQWRFHHNTLTLIIPMVLALVFLSVAILWRYKRIIRRLLHENNPVSRSAISFDSSEIATAEHETFYNVEMPDICLRDATVFDPDWGIHQPPPYSPRDDLDPIAFVGAVDGEPPPPYEDVVRQGSTLSPTSNSKTFCEHSQQTATGTG